ncbi:YqfQ family protein [Tannockella kyphosi]|uniref:YqfQ family protein n=1 Tax=Tannockella kyphosi TaxID=2899121 RepID=UPI00201343D1|nr:YqfQ family protein [Tannockella kyphosi]
MQQQNNNNYPYPMNYYPYYPNQSMQRSNPLTNMNQKFGLSNMIQTTTKTVRTVNQVIPIINQVSPLINNARNAITLLRALHTIDDIDLSIIDEALAEEIEEEIVTTKSQEKQGELFENMV